MVSEDVEDDVAHDKRYADGSSMITSTLERRAGRIGQIRGDDDRTTGCHPVKIGPGDVLFNHVSFVRIDATTRHTSGQSATGVPRSLSSR